MGNDQVLRAGDKAADFELPDSAGKLQRLSSLVQSGPRVLVFYRGYW